MRKIYMILPIMLALLFIAGISPAQDIDSAQNNTSLADNTSASNTSAENTSAENTIIGNMSTDDTNADNMSADNTSSDGSPAQPVDMTENTTDASVPNLKYIWSVTGIEDEKVLVALDQDGSDIFGQAKYEPDGGDPWNGIVDGSITGDQVKLVITAQKGKNLESIKLNGALADEAISGKFTKISGGKITSSGEFNALWISDDLSNFEPAKVTEAASQAVTAPVQTDNTTSAATGQTAQQPVQLGKKTKYVDVHEYADKIGPGGDLSGIPPGMSGII